MGVTAVCCQQEACPDSAARPLEGVASSSHVVPEAPKSVTAVVSAGEPVEKAEVVGSTQHGEARIPFSVSTQASEDNLQSAAASFAGTKGAELEPSVQTYKEFEICAQRGSDGSIGLDLRHAGGHLTIVAIHPHRRPDVESWISPTGQSIIVGDKIIAVNDIAGNDARMVETCRRMDSLTFRIRRDADISRGPLGQSVSSLSDFSG
mmetsp:Transcript_8041/g.18793  ORF Transcript_8041/g.18793 Transcript_8041/m.18793 type:complete len:206 (+) Transcript_8041:47-664(+)